MSNLRSQSDQICSFFSTFKVLEHSQESTILSSSSNNTFLLKNIQIQEEEQPQQNLHRNSANFNSRRSNRNSLNSEIREMLNTLTQHQQFDQKYILTLLSFEIVNGSNPIGLPEQPKKQGAKVIRAIYEYGQKSLSQQIENRKSEDSNFDEEELWVLLSSVSHALLYLQSKSVVYGVLDSCRVFLDQNIRLLDPSCTGINPYEMEEERIYSPELRQLIEQQQNLEEDDEEVDMFKSDIYILGVIVVQAALLDTSLRDLNSSNKEDCLREIGQRYSEELCQMLRFMLNDDPSQRPSFSQVIDQLSQMFEFSRSEVEYLKPLCAEREDQPPEPEALTQGQQFESCDILYDESRPSEEKMPTEYELVRKKYILETIHSFEDNSEIQSVSDSLNLTGNSIILEDMEALKSVSRRKGGYKTRELKEKLINPCADRSANRQKGSCISICTQTAQREEKKWKDSQNNNFPETKRNIEYMPNKENLLTNPELLTMIRQCRTQIEQKTMKKPGMQYSDSSHYALRH